MNAAAVAPAAPPPPPPERFDEEPSFDVEPPPPIARPLAFAAGGAVLGALLWAGIACMLEMEIGYVAWAVGGLVGGGMVLGGGRGAGHAGLAALLALVGIAGGKFYGTHLLVEGQLAQLEEQMFSRAAFENMRSMARQMAESPAPAGELMAQLGDEVDFSETEIEEMNASLTQEAARFAHMLDEGYTYESWRAEQIAEMRASFSLTEVVTESLDGIDLLFALLGLVTAFGVVQRASQRSVV